MQQEIKVGDVVQLKSGGPSMTVVFLHEGGLVSCQWFERSKAQSGQFPALALKADETETGSFDIDDDYY